MHVCMYICDLIFFSETLTQSIEINDSISKCSHHDLFLPTTYCRIEIYS